MLTTANISILYYYSTVFYIKISNNKKIGRKKCAEHLYFKYPIIQGKRRLYSFLSYCSCLSLRDCIAIFMCVCMFKFEIPFSSPLLKSFFFLLCVSIFFYKYCLSVLMVFRFCRVMLYCLKKGARISKRHILKF